MLPAFHRERIEAAHAIMTARDAAGARPRQRRHAVRPLPLHARAGAADRDARALRAGPRSGARRRHQRGARVRGGAGLLGARLPAPDPARPRLAVAADGGRPQAAGRADLRRDRPPPRERGGGRGHPRACCSRPPTRTARTLSQAPHPRRGHDADVRRPRHDDLDGRLPLPRAGPQPGARRRPVVRPRPGHRRDAAPVPAGVDRAAPLDRPLRLRRPGTLPGGVPVNYCSWASHRLPDVWPEPDAFRPERFAPGNRERIAKGAYVPFGGGSRMCIGMRFGLAEVGVIAAAILERFRLELAPGYRLQTRQMPTIGPKHGMPMVPRAAKGGPVARARPGRVSATCRPSRSARRSRRPWSGSRPPTGPRSGCCPSARASSSCRSRWPRS